MRRFYLIALALLLLLALTGCGGDDSETADEPVQAVDEEPFEQQPFLDEGENTEAEGDPEAGATVFMEEVNFAPGEVRVSAGQSVIWENRDNFAHTVTAGSPADPATDLFDSGDILQEQDFSFVFNEPGQYAYFCRIHPQQMQGVVIVE